MNKMIAKRYMVIKHIGQGGMADVYVAVDMLLNREVAVKVLRGELSNDPVALLRFQREANASTALSHPNIVDIYDVGEENGYHYIVMEYVRGKDLKQLIAQRGALCKEEAVAIMKQLVSAVAEAHRCNIIHRDIKPQNVLIKDDGTLKVVDFGIALAQDALQLTQSDSVMGSVHYLAPEVARGEAATRQSDIYSLGIVFYELLSGEVPFHGEQAVQIAMKHMREEIPSIRKLNPQLPQAVENVILRATAKNKNFRYPNCEAMLQDLTTCLSPQRADEPRVVFKTPSEGNKTIAIDTALQNAERGQQDDRHRHGPAQGERFLTSLGQAEQKEKETEEEKQRLGRPADHGVSRTVNCGGGLYPRADRQLGRQKPAGRSAAVDQPDGRAGSFHAQRRRAGAEPCGDQLRVNRRRGERPDL